MAESRTIVITGVTKGLGRAMCEGFVALGHKVLGCGRSEAKLAELAERFGPPHDFSAVDVSEDASVGRWAQTLLAEHGAPELLLNNAALINENAPLWEVPPEEFDRVMDVNIKGVFYAIRHFVPAMIAEGRGVIVNFSSTWGRSTSSDVAPYCTSKWAIEGLSQSLAQDLPRGLASVALNPGIIHTEMLETCFGSGASAYWSPEQWAQVAIPFLLGLGAKDNGRPLSVG